jgi:hypothetical protein
MINNDSVVTAYDEHLTLVEWLQKVEVLLKNGGLKETTLNDKGNATFSLTLTFNDGTKLESNAMTLTSVNEALASVNTALTNLNHDLDTATHRIDDLEDEVDYHGFNMTQPFDKTNCVRIGTEFSTDEWTLKRSDDEIELSDEDANKAKQILLKAIKYGFVAYVDSPNNVYGGLVNALVNAASFFVTFILNMSQPLSVGFLVIYLRLENGKWKYRCFND